MTSPDGAGPVGIAGLFPHDPDAALRYGTRYPPLTPLTTPGDPAFPRHRVCPQTTLKNLGPGRCIRMWGAADGTTGPRSRPGAATSSAAPR